MTKYDFLPKTDDIIYYLLMIVLGAVMVMLTVPGVLYLTTDHKASVDLAASTNDPAFQSWLSSNNYELISAETTNIRKRGILKVRIKEPNKE